MKFLSGVLNVVSKVLDVVKSAVNVVASIIPIPIIKGALRGLSAGIASVNDLGDKTGTMMLNGVPPKQAFEAASKGLARDLAGTAMSAIPGGGVAKGAVAVPMEGAEAEAMQGVKLAAKVGLEGAATTMTKAEFKDTVKECVKEVAKDDVMNAAMARAHEVQRRRAQEEAQAQRQA